MKCKDVRKMTREAKSLYYNLEFTRYKEDIYRKHGKLSMMS